MMISSIVDGISEALASLNLAYDYKIYTEPVEQGLKEPCFSVVCINPKSRLFFNKRYKKTNLFCVHYFPKEGQQECVNVVDALFDTLEVITVNGDKLRGTNMHAEFVDGVVSFFVNYDLFTLSPDASVKMGSYKQDIKARR